MTNPPGPEEQPPQQPQQPPPYQPAPPPGHYPGPRLAGLPPDHPQMVAHRRRKRKRMFIVLAVAILGFGGLFTLFVLFPDPGEAEVGECLSGTSASNMKILSCDDPKAEYKVAETHDDVSRDRAAFVCELDAVTKVFFKGGRALCLAPLHP
jgi:hypothetical protein